MLSAGQTVELIVNEVLDHGLVLGQESLAQQAWSEESGNEQVFMPAAAYRDVPAVGDTLRVFLNRNSDGSLEAGLQFPKAQVGEVALLRVNQVNQVGIFLDWGLDKDLFLPFSNQRQPMEEGKRYLVYIYVDHSGRVVSTAKIDRFIQDESTGLKVGEKVNAIVASRTDLGYKCVIEQKFWGLLYKDQVFQRLRQGLELEVFISGIREDGKVDLSLQAPIAQRLPDLAERILERLSAEGGYMAMNDKSAPELIQAVFGVSKGNFKKAIGTLYKAGKIKISATGIVLVEEVS
ncbi:GntR family transcriptional regulator [Alginatibacterium sediminis]|uniref:GntR family transcriptional regulator n=1 Tax=Alginatibacterium sediminis TaxID=2164068 RepID=A0A420ECU5_9ALTE|nr:S1-like domain-containing RNA-binding protein [Alginatibacterium sediminis]RKF18496.1 GntR family transcriptional regulator [Alginatibacterium sediminis]